MRLRGILFDLDGTLADTASAERSAWPALAELIRRHVPAIDVEELHDRYYTVFEPHWAAFLEGTIDFTEYRRRRLRDAVSPWYDLDDELFEAYRVEKRRTLVRLRAFDDAVPTIRELRRHGLCVGLLTNGPSDLQRSKLAVTRLGPELDAVAVSEEIGAAKPDERAFHRAAGLLGCDPADLAMVGDSPLHDIQGALAAGLAAAVLVRHGPAGPEADGIPVVRTLSEVPAALGLER